MRGILSCGLTALIVASGMVAAADLDAQDGSRFSIEARGGVGIGAYDLAASGTHWAPRPTFALAAEWHASSFAAPYIGYSRLAAGCDLGFCEQMDVSYTSAGLDAGVRLSLPVVARPWLRLGAVLHEFEQLWAGPTFGSTAIGLDTAAGIELPLTSRLSLMPSLRYTRLSVPAEDGARDAAVFITTDLGLRVGL